MKERQRLLFEKGSFVFQEKSEQFWLYRSLKFAMQRHVPEMLYIIDFFQTGIC